MNCKTIFPVNLQIHLLQSIKVSKAEYPHGAQPGLLSDDKSCCLLLRSSGRLSNLFNEMDENKNGN